MRATLICPVEGADPSALVQELSKDADDRSTGLLELFDQLRDLEPGTDDPRGDRARLAGRVAEVLDETAMPVVVCHEQLWDVLQPLGAVARGTFTVLAVVTSPLVAADRISSGAGTSRALGLARYERSLRRVLTSLGGIAAVVALEDDPPESVRTALEENVPGGRLTAGWPEAPGPPGPGEEWVPPEIERLWRAALAKRGAHQRFVPGDLGAPSEWGEELVRLDDEAEQSRAALLFTARQLASVMEIDPTARVGVGTRPASDDPDDQFREAGEGEPYRLNASEDRHAYHRWLTWKREPVSIGGELDPPLRRAVTKARRSPPRFSVVVPVYRPPLWALERCVASVLAQEFAAWELCLCDDASGDAALSAYLRSLRRVDRRITVVTSEKNGGIADATNRAIAASRGEFVAFLDHDDELAPRALGSMAAAIERDGEADLLYSDEDKIDRSGERFDPLFKPAWSPDLLLSFAYTNHLTVMRRSLIDQVGGLRTEFDGSQDYDLTLRVSERARHIVHLPEVLYHWRSLPGSAASDSGGSQAKPWAYEAGRRAIADALERRGEPAEVTAIEEFPGRYHVRRIVTARPLVSIIIPFRDEPALLETCTRTLREHPGYEPVELVLVDNGSTLPETATLLESLGSQPGVRIVEAPGPFNWAAINNAAARACSGELLLFMNNDIEARQPGWLDAMVGHALRPEVGAVGARLLYPDGTIQHAGVVIGLGGIAGHVLRGLPGDRPGYNSIALQTRDCSVVTGAAMMVRREVFFEVGGFDEELAVAFNDVDFCLKLREQGYLVVFTPLAELIHHESKSRGHTDDFAESRRILDRWAEVIVAGDPYMNVHLSHWRYWCPLSTAQEDDRWRNYLETRVLTRDSSSNE